MNLIQNRSVVSTVLFIFSLFLTVHCKVFYVSNSGNDETGKPDSIDSPYQNLKSLLLSDGDTIKLKGKDVFKYPTYDPSLDIFSYRINWDSYEGQPIILGSFEQNWQEVQHNVWETSYEVPKGLYGIQCEDEDKNNIVLNTRYNIDPLNSKITLFTNENPKDQLIEISYSRVCLKKNNNNKLSFSRFSLLQTTTDPCSLCTAVEICNIEGICLHPCEVKNCPEGELCTIDGTCVATPGGEGSGDDEGFVGSIGFIIIMIIVGLLLIGVIAGLVWFFVIRDRDSGWSGGTSQVELNNTMATPPSTDPAPTPQAPNIFKRASMALGKGAHFEVGDHCRAQYEADGQYYAATILEYDAPSFHFLVVFDEYGNQQWTLPQKMQRT